MLADEIAMNALRSGKPVAEHPSSQLGLGERILLPPSTCLVQFRRIGAIIQYDLPLMAEPPPINGGPDAHHA
jgi:hypothetical protein